MSRLSSEPRDATLSVSVLTLTADTLARLNSERTAGILKSPVLIFMVDMKCPITTALEEM
jgi:hypothetical protein